MRAQISVRLAAFVAALSLAASPAVCGEAAGAGGQAFRGARAPEQVGFVNAISQDGKAMTILFDSLLVASGNNEPLSLSRTLTLKLNLAAANKPAKLVHHIRGYAQVDPGARAVLVVQAAGKTTLVDLDQARKDAVPAKNQCAERFEIVNGEARKLAKEQFEETENPPSADFFVAIEGEVPADTAYHLTCFLLIERDSTKSGGAYLAIDSIDVGIVD